MDGAAHDRDGAEELDPLSEPETVPEGADETVTAGGRARGDYFVQSLERGLAVIKAFTADEPELTLSDIARRTGMTRAAARRFVLTLVDLDYVGTADRRFHLRPSVLELGYTYLSVMSVPQVMAPHLTALSDRLNETVSAAVLDGDDIVYVAWVGPRRVRVGGITIGTRLPAYLTSHGRVQLAALPDEELDAHLGRTRLEARTSKTITDPVRLREVLGEVRAHGYALVDQELEEGVTSIAVPVRDSQGTVVASVNVGTHSRRLSPTALRRAALQPLQETARLVERDIGLLGVRPTPPGQL
ncbi:MULTISPECIES: IclR family transcriptional regulator domain-containing protein [unclassified Geodermatophilus]|uniref:IclR family transcriptional regulator domain-containing protein n=1 Tax=unclassified Geodermatophilus TaxID=2637632 RepID=UPI003EEC7578